jgi:serine/threonine-protein kinase RsbW
MTAPITSELTLASNLAEARYVQELIEFALQASAYSERDVCVIKIATEEALINAITHGNHNDPAKRVCITFTVTAERFDVRIEDEGMGFAPEDDPDPPPGLYRPSGRGILLMRAFMTEVQFHGRGNVVTMSKVRETS